MPDIGPAGKFTGQGITAPATPSGMNIDTLGPTLQKLGIDPGSAGTGLSSQLGAVGGQVERVMNQKINELRELQRAQKSGVEVSNLEGRLANLTSEITSMSNLVRDILSRGLPNALRSPETGRFVSNPDAMRQLTRTATRMQGVLPQGFTDDALIGDEELPSPFLAKLSQIRSKTRMGRVIARDVEGGMDDDFRNELKRSQQELIEAIPEKIKEWNSAANAGDEEGSRMAQIEATQASNLSKEIQHVLEYNVKNQGNSLNKMMSHVGNIVATIGAANIASRVFLQEPYQFRTRPALGVLGQQGEVGSMLGGAFGELEQYKLGLNQQALYTGAAMVGTGFAMGGVPGALLGLGGAAVGATGLLGNAADAYFKIPGTTGPEEILSQSLVQAVANPERLVGNFTSARAGLFSAMGSGEDRESNFGYTLGPGSRGNSQTGNTILDRMGALTGLGYSQDQLGALLSQTALGLRGGPGDMTTYATTAGQIGAAYGIDEGAVLSNMQTAQRYGSQDARESLMMAMGAAADSDGKITSYTSNVLVPALMKVTESMALQNLARSSGELEREVYGLRRSLVDSGTNLGQLVEQNPEVMARVMNTIQGAIGASMENPAMLAYDLAMGSSFADVALRRPIVMQNKIESLLNSPHLSGIDFSNMDSVFGNPLAYSGLSYAQSITGINDIQMLMQLMSVVQGGGSLVGLDGGLSEEAQSIVDGAQGDLDTRIAEIIGSDLGVLAASLAEQTNEALKTSQTLVDEMLILQQKISEFLMDDKIVDYAKQGIDSIVAKVNEFLGSNPTYGGLTASEIAELDDIYSPSSVDDAYATPDPGRVLNADIDAILSGIFENAELIRHRAAHNPEVFSGINELWRTASTPGGEVDPRNAYDFFREGVMDLIPELREGSEGSYGFPGGDAIAAISGSRTQAASSERLSTTKTGASTFVTLRIHGMDVENIYQVASEAAEDYIVRNRFNYG